MKTIKTKTFIDHVDSAISDINDDSRGLEVTYASVDKHVTRVMKFYDEYLNNYCDENYEYIITEQMKKAGL